VAAYRIRVAVGPEPTILMFDPADRPGGVLRTERLCGQPMDIGAEAFVARRPEVPALLAELGLADRQITPTGVRPTIYSRDRLHPLPPGAVNGIPSSAQSLEGLVDQATLARVAAEPDAAMPWHPGADPSVGAGGSGNKGGSIDGCRQHKTVVVVGVLANQVDATRSADNQARRLPIMGLKQCMYLGGINQCHLVLP
jgi:hypothetical protein